MKVFVYEFLTGGGLLIDPSLCPFAKSLSVEGFAMLRAVVEDFVAIDDVDVIVLKDDSIWELNGCGLVDREKLCCVSVKNKVEAERAIVEQAKLADWTLVIAPEIDSHLLRIVKQLEDAGARLLSPNSTFVETAADKLRVSELLLENGCPTIETRMRDKDAINELFDKHQQLVTKPRFGAGSGGVRVVSCREEVASADSQEEMLVQPLIQGIPLSVSAITGRHESIRSSIQFMPPCFQRLAKHAALEPFAYQGGSLPVDEQLSKRATRLAKRALSLLPETIGFCGADLLLGDCEDGSDDVVVEINPRLTTSYAGLRAACEDNMAEAMIDAASGEPFQLKFSDDHVAFDCTGAVEIARCKS